MDRDGSPEMLNAGSMNLHVSAHPSYLNISKFQVSVVYIQQHKHTTKLQVIHQHESSYMFQR